MGEFAVAMAASLLTVVGTVGGMWYIHIKEEDTRDQQRLLSKALLTATLEEERREYIPRPSLESKIFTHVSTECTTMISGPQGVGKSTTVNHALQKMEGVVRLTLTTGTLEEFETKILSKVNFKSHNLVKVAVIHQALLDIEKSGKNH